MRHRRTIYFNDARHYYLFAFEPPMRMEEAWRAVDEVAGTAIDTFIYGVECGDGLFYPSKVGMQKAIQLSSPGRAEDYDTRHGQRFLVKEHFAFNRGNAPD